MHTWNVCKFVKPDGLDCRLNIPKIHCITDSDTLHNWLIITKTCDIYNPVQHAAINILDKIVSSKYFAIPVQYNN